MAGPRGDRGHDVRRPRRRSPSIPWVRFGSAQPRGCPARLIWLVASVHCSRSTSPTSARTTRPTWLAGGRHHLPGVDVDHQPRGAHGRRVQRRALSAAASWRPASPEPTRRSSPRPADAPKRSRGGLLRQDPQAVRPQVRPRVVTVRRQASGKPLALTRPARRCGTSPNGRSCTVIVATMFAVLYYAAPKHAGAVPLAQPRGRPRARRLARRRGTVSVLRRQLRLVRTRPTARSEASSSSWYGCGSPTSRCSWASSSTPSSSAAASRRPASPEPRRFSSRPRRTEAQQRRSAPDDPQAVRPQVRPRVVTVRGMRGRPAANATRSSSF